MTYSRPSGTERTFGCLSLKVGATLVGWICMLQSIFALRAFLIFVALISDEEPLSTEMTRFIIWYRVVQPPLCLFTFVACITLLAGIGANCSQLINWWLNVYYFATAVDLNFHVYFLRIAPPTWTWSLALVPVMLARIYFLLVVLGHYKATESSERFRSVMDGLGNGKKGARQGCKESNNGVWMTDGSQLAIEMPAHSGGGENCGEMECPRDVKKEKKEKRNEWPPMMLI